MFCLFYNRPTTHLARCSYTCRDDLPPPFSNQHKTQNAFFFANGRLPSFFACACKQNWKVSHADAATSGACGWPTTRRRQEHDVKHMTFSSAMYTYRYAQHSQRWRRMPSTEPPQRRKYKSTDPLVVKQRMEISLPVAVTDCFSRRERRARHRQPFFENGRGRRRLCQQVKHSFAFCKHCLELLNEVCVLFDVVRHECTPVMLSSSGVHISHRLRCSGRV